MTPWSTDARVEGDDVVVSVLLSTDPGPMREFRPFLEFALDEAHASELFGRLSIELRRLRDAKATNHHSPREITDVE